MLLNCLRLYLAVLNETVDDQQTHEFNLVFFSVCLTCLLCASISFDFNLCELMQISANAATLGAVGLCVAGGPSQRERAWSSGGG